MTFIAHPNSAATKLLRHVETNLTEQGDVILYEDVIAVTGIDVPEGVSAGQFLSSVVEQVNKRLHRAGDWRHLQNIMREGYRIASPSEIREEVLGRSSAIERQMVRVIRASEKVVRHPDATVAERRRASDATASQSTLLTMVRREHRQIRSGWPVEETSPVLAD